MNVLRILAKLKIVPQVAKDKKFIIKLQVFHTGLTNHDAPPQSLPFK